jgi:hypothetical protein
MDLKIETRFLHIGFVCNNKVYYKCSKCAGYFIESEASEHSCDPSLFHEIEIKLDPKDVKRLKDAKVDASFRREYQSNVPWPFTPYLMTMRLGEVVKAGAALGRTLGSYPDPKTSKPMLSIIPEEVNLPKSGISFWVPNS